MQTSAALKLNNKHLGDEFEQSFLRSLAAAGHYVRQMPPRVGYDFTVGIGSKLKPMELKYIVDGRLRLKHFTQIEINVAEEMTDKGVEYYIAYPLVTGFGVTTWRRVRGHLLSGQPVNLDNSKAVMWLPDERFLREEANNV